MEKFVAFRLVGFPRSVEDHAHYMLYTATEYVTSAVRAANVKPSLFLYRVKSAINLIFPESVEFIAKFGANSSRLAYGPLRYLVEQYHHRMLDVVHTRHPNFECAIRVFPPISNRRKSMFRLFDKAYVKHGSSLVRMW